jgi:lipoyl(octanoyl) transferase
MHGFAFNVCPDLGMFNGIVPCGISDRWVTSVEEVTGVKRSVKEVASIAADHLAEIFDRGVVWTHPSTMKELASAGRRLEGTRH